MQNYTFFCIYQNIFVILPRICIKMRKRAFIGSLILVLLCSAAPLSAKENTNEKGGGMRFFYLVGQWMDNFCLAGVDTNYICLPEHSWRVAFTNSEVGVYTQMAHEYSPGSVVALNAYAQPSIELGFNLGYRGFGFGYAWDVKSAYARNWNISFGSKWFGFEFARQRSTNISAQLTYDGKDAGDTGLQPGCPR